MGTSAFTGAPVMFESNVDSSNMYAGQLSGRNTLDSSDAKRPPLFSMQSSIVSKREESAAEKYGQITPPEEPGSEGPSKKRPKMVSAETDPAKSERARNAANKRHEASRKKSKEWLDNPDQLASSEDGDAEGQRQKYREKNRLAAAKCRAKKKENNDGLEESARDMSKLNTALKQEVQAIRQELTTLRTYCLAHQPGGDCKCRKIHQYNHNRAQAMATEHPYRNMSLSPSFGDTITSLRSGDGSGGDFGSMDQQMYDQMMRGSVAGMPPNGMAGSQGQVQAFGDSKFPFSNVTTPDSVHAMTPTMPAGQQGFGDFSFDPSVGIGNMGGWQ